MTPVVVEPVAELVLGVAGLAAGVSLGALGDLLDASSCSSTSSCSARRVDPPSAIMASLCRIPATRSRSAAVARTAAAAGLFSSWVSPADSEPSASSRSRSPTMPLAVAHAEEQPLQQVHRHREPARASSRANSSAGSTKNSHVGDRPHGGRVRRWARSVAQVGLQWRRRTTPRWSVRLISTSSPPTSRRQQRPCRTAARRSRSAGSPSVTTVSPAGTVLDVAVLGRASRAARRSSDSNRNSVAAARPAAQRSVRVICCLQVPVHERDGHRALADGRRDPLHRLGPHVAGHEHAGHAGLQVVRVARSSVQPAGRRPSDDQVGPGEHEAARVADDARRPSQSVRGCGADEDEQPGGRRPSPCSPVGLSRSVEPLQVLVAGALDHLGAGAHLDVGDPRRSGSIR